MRTTNEMTEVIPLTSHQGRIETIRPNTYCDELYWKYRQLVYKYYNVLQYRQLVYNYYN